MPNPWPVTIRTPDGDIVEVDFTATGRVYLFTSYQGAWLDGPQFEELSKALIAAKWAAVQGAYRREVGD